MNFADETNKKTNDNNKSGTKSNTPSGSKTTPAKTDTKKTAAFPWLWVIIGVVVVLALGGFAYTRMKKDGDAKEGQKAEGGDVELYIIKDVQDELI